MGHTMEAWAFFNLMRPVGGGGVVSEKEFPRRGTLCLRSFLFVFFQEEEPSIFDAAAVAAVVSVVFGGGGADGW